MRATSSAWLNMLARGRFFDLRPERPHDLFLDNFDFGRIFQRVEGLEPIVDHMKPHGRFQATQGAASASTKGTGMYLSPLLGCPILALALLFTNGGNEDFS